MIYICIYVYIQKTQDIYIFFLGGGSVLPLLDLFVQCVCARSFQAIIHKFMVTKPVIVTKIYTYSSEEKETHHP